VAATPLSPLAALAPTLVADRFAPLGRELVDLLRGLSRSDWERPTIAGSWQVRDVAAHLLDTACRQVSGSRDGVGMPPPEQPIASDADLVAFLNRRNGEWVAALRRVGPSVLVEWIAGVEPPFAAAMEALDPWAAARFGVSWAGEFASVQWFDTARELTERWHHQEQIRVAVGAPSLCDGPDARPVLETFLRALPFRYRGLERPAGTAFEFRFTGGAEELAYALVAGADGWELRHGNTTEGAAESAAALEMPIHDAWKLLTKGLSPDVARQRARTRGEQAAFEPFFLTRAIVG
jgi:uncharacterized protein (TIGR03083 family)